MIDSFCGIFFYGFSYFLWLLLPFMEFSVNGKNRLKIFATNFLPIFHLHCYRQVVSILKFIPDYSVKLLFLKCLH